MKKFINSLSLCLTNSSKKEYPDKHRELYTWVFDKIMDSVEATSICYNEQMQLKGISHTPEIQQLLTLMENLLLIEFNISQHPISGKDPQIWQKMEILCQKYLENKVLIPIWKMTILDSTNKLIDDMSNFTLEELKELCNDDIYPFKGFTMKTEYFLQVLYNAHCSKEDPKYAKIFETSIYKDCFSNWFLLLRLIRIPFNKEPSANSIDATILLTYIESNVSINDSS